MIFAPVAFQVPVEVLDGVIEHHAGRNALDPVVLAVLACAFGASLGQSPQSNRRDQVPALAVGVGAAHRSGGKACQPLLGQYDYFANRFDPRLVHAVAPFLQG